MLRPVLPSLVSNGSPRGTPIWPVGISGTAKAAVFTTVGLLQDGPFPWCNRRLGSGLTPLVALK